jgi:hypothetical protein
MIQSVILRCDDVYITASCAKCQMLHSTRRFSIGANTVEVEIRDF